MGHFKLVLDVGDKDSIGVLGELPFGPSVMLLLLLEESGEPRTVEDVKVVVGESPQLPPLLDFMDIGD